MEKKSFLAYTSRSQSVIEINQKLKQKLEAETMDVRLLGSSFTTHPEPSSLFQGLMLLTVGSALLHQLQDSLLLTCSQSSLD